MSVWKVQVFRQSEWQDWASAGTPKLCAYLACLLREPYRIVPASQPIAPKVIQR